MNEQANLVIDTLKAAAAALQDQDKDLAIRTLSSISAEVNQSLKATVQATQEAQKAQQDVNTQISELIRKQGEAHAAQQQAVKTLETTNSEITAKHISIQELNKLIGRYNGELATYTRQLRACEARIAELNDKSAGSIIRSIFCLGLDRAIMAISIEIDGVRQKINTTNHTIARYAQELSGLQHQLHENDTKAAALALRISGLNDQIRQLDFLEFKLHNQENLQRKRLVFFTELHLFYLKLQNLLHDMTHKIEDVRDIVEALNSQKPTIASFDPTRKDLISLQEAIRVFAAQAGSTQALMSFDPEFDEQQWYYISSQWQGTERPLTVAAGANGHLISITQKDGSDGQLWRIKKRSNGYFQLINKLTAPTQSLDVLNDGVNNKVCMADNGNYSGQHWKIDPEFGYCRLSTLWLGEYRSLDIINDGINNKLHMTHSGNYSGQHWTFTAAS